MSVAPPLPRTGEELREAIRWHVRHSLGKAWEDATNGDEASTSSPFSFEPAPYSAGSSAGSVGRPDQPRSTVSRSR